MADKKIEMLDEVSRREDILTTDLDGEVGMFNVETGKYYTLDHVSSNIWHLIEKPIRVKQIVSNLLEQYEIDEVTCSQQIIEFLTKLHEMKLLNIQKEK